MKQVEVYLRLNFIRELVVLSPHPNVRKYQNVRMLSLYFGNPALSSGKVKLRLFPFMIPYVGKCLLERTLILDPRHRGVGWPSPSSLPLSAKC